MDNTEKSIMKLLLVAVMVMIGLWVAVAVATFDSPAIWALLGAAVAAVVGVVWVMAMHSDADANDGEKNQRRQAC